MEILKDTNLEVVASAYHLNGRPIHQSAETIGWGLSNLLITSGMVDDIPFNNNRKMIDVLGEYSIGAVTDMLSTFLGIRPIPSDVFGAFCNLTVIIN